jgi:hypothetical protein
MKTLKRAGAVVLLALVLGLPAFADCLPPVPGQTDTPPCTAVPAASDDPAAPGETSTPLATDSVDVFAISKVTVDLLLEAIF